MRKSLFKIFGLLFLGLLLAWVCLIYSSSDAPRVRHYFAIDSGTPLNQDTIKSALLARFPIGTPISQAIIWLAAQGLGGPSQTAESKDGVDYIVIYDDDWGSSRRLDVWFTIDNQRKIQDIGVQDISYSL